MNPIFNTPIANAKGTEYKYKLIDELGYQRREYNKPGQITAYLKRLKNYGRPVDKYKVKICAVVTTDIVSSEEFEIRQKLKTIKRDASWPIYAKFIYTDKDGKNYLLTEYPAYVNGQWQINASMVIDEIPQGGDLGELRKIK
jgi:hypothetical protein